MRLAVTTMSLRLAEPFRRASDSVSAVHALVIELTEGAATGIGAARMAESAPAQHRRLVAAAVEYGARLDTEGAAPQRRSGRQRLSEPAAAAFDIALADLRARQGEVSIARLWKLPDPTAGVSAITLGALPAADLLDRAAQLSDWPILKLKVGPTVDPDLFGRLRTCYSGRLWVDANGSFDAAAAAALLPVLADAGVELFEQPLPPPRRAQLASLRGSTPVRLVADENLRSVAEIDALAGVVDVVNVKPGSCGGLSVALELVKAARSRGLQVMIGTRTGSAVEVAAAAQLRGVADYLDLDGHLDIVDDPFSGVSMIEGRLELASQLGHGAFRSDSAALTGWRYP